MEKRIVAPHGQNTTYVQFVLTSGPPIRLHLRPFVTCRMHDAGLTNGQAGPYPITVTHGRYEITLPEGLPPLKLCLRPQCGVFVTDDLVSSAVSYRIDRDRGSEHIEDLFSPGYFTVELQPGESVAMVASVEPWDQLDFDCGAILEAERQRLENSPGLFPISNRTTLCNHSNWPRINSLSCRERGRKNKCWRRRQATRRGR